MCQDSHHHNFFLYSRSLKKKESECACIHASIACTLWLSREREGERQKSASKQTEKQEEHKFDCLLMFFRTTIVANNSLFLSRSSFLFIIIFFLCYYIYIALLVTHITNISASDDQCQYLVTARARVCVYVWQTSNNTKKSCNSIDNRKQRGWKSSKIDRRMLDQNS